MRCGSRSARRQRTTACWRPGHEDLTVKIPTLFIDRDGTLIEEPPDNQVDALAKVRFMPGVFAALSELSRHGYQFAMVTNQDGLGTERFPRAGFEEAQRFVLEAFRSQGIRFDDVFVCPHAA